MTPIEFQVDGEDTWQDVHDHDPGRVQTAVRSLLETGAAVVSLTYEASNGSRATLNYREKVC